jgi:hypothetical protein
MKFSFSNLLAIASILVWATAWAATEKKAVSADNVPAQSSPASVTKLYTEVSFPKGSDALSAKDRAKIDGLVNGAQKIGKVSEVRVISWADAAYPAAKNQKLSDAQRTLADHRNKAIENELSNRDVDVKTYNMAEKPGALAELLSTSDAKVKKSLAQAGITGKHGNKISKAMVLVIMNE